MFLARNSSHRGVRRLLFYFLVYRRFYLKSNVGGQEKENSISTIFFSRFKISEVGG